MKTVDINDMTKSERLHLLADLMEYDLRERRRASRFVVDLFTSASAREGALAAETEERRGEQVDLAARLSIGYSQQEWDSMYPEDRAAARERVIALLDVGADISGVADVVG